MTEEVLAICTNGVPISVRFKDGEAVGIRRRVVMKRRIDRDESPCMRIQTAG